MLIHCPELSEKQNKTKTNPANAAVYLNSEKNTETDHSKFQSISYFICFILI